MTNPIRDVEKLTQKQIDTARRRGERELRHIQNIHENMKADLKSTQANELVDIRQTHDSHVNGETARKERLLQEIKSQLDETKRLTEKELKSLKYNSFKEKAAMAQKNTFDRERINAEQELFLEDQNFRFNQKAKKVHADGENQIEEMQSTMNDKYLHTEKQGQEKINRQTAEFTTRFREDEKKYSLEKETQDKRFKSERFSTNIRQQGELKKMAEHHNQFIDSRDKNFRQGLKKQDLFFEKRFETQLKGHHAQLKALEEKNHKIVEDMKSSLTEEITRTAVKQDDPFFKITALRPELRQFEDRVEITVPVPEYSKADIQLTVHQKEAILSFNRRFSDASKLADGTINKVNKVESFTTRIPTMHMLDPKTVKSTYEDGIMKYTIKRV